MRARRVQDVHGHTRQVRETMHCVRREAERQRYHRDDPGRFVLLFCLSSRVGLMLGVGTGYAAGGLAETSKKGIAFQG